MTEEYAVFDLDKAEAVSAAMKAAKPMTDKEAIRELNRLYLIGLYSLNGRWNPDRSSVGRAYQAIVEGLHGIQIGIALHGSWRRYVDDLRAEWVAAAALTGNGSAEALYSGWADSLTALVIEKEDASMGKKRIESEIAPHTLDNAKEGE
ncbi:MAG: hypothetical protein GY906_10310 [bacterium]|nr:hypothetical protein [bacterium]